MKQTLLIASLIVTTSLWSNYESDCVKMDLESVDTAALAKDLNLKQKLLDRFKQQGRSSKRFNYLSQIFGIFVRYYLGKMASNLGRIGYRKINTTRDINHELGLYLVTLLFTWRGAIEWQQAYTLATYKDMSESAHWLAFIMATCAPSLIPLPS